MSWLLALLAERNPQITKKFLSDPAFPQSQKEAIRRAMEGKGHDKTK
jgi:hypothetical protein